jgi:hypothetical protein
VAGYSYRVGETILVGLDAISGDASIVGSVTSQLRSIVPGGAPGPVVATFAVVARPATITPPAVAGWNLTVTAAASALLAPGSYVMDARLALTGGVVEYTDPLQISLVAPVTS